jgi:hypothetical protein
MMTGRVCRLIGTWSAIWVMAVLAGASPAAAQTPGYITAKPDAAMRAFGGETAKRIFSKAYTPARQQAVLRSQKTIPGFDCPSDPQIALAEVIPFPLKQGTPSWIERYVVACTPRTMRNFLLILEGDQPRVIEMLPGATNTDPLLQRDALKGGYTAVAAVAPKDCDKPVVADTRLTSKLERATPWTERWMFDLCGTRAEVEMTFTPSVSSGTTWSASLIK